MGRRAGYLALVALVGFTVGLASRSQPPVAPHAFAAYQAYENLTELTEASDLVIRGRQGRGDAVP